MFHLLGKFPRTHFHVACSGGSDSMVLVDFIRHNPKNDFDIIYFNHGTTSCQEAEDFLKSFCLENNITLHLGKITREKNVGESREDYWRKERYKFFSKFSNEPIILAHHLNDCIETWVMTSLKGNPLLIPYNNPKYNIFRPFLLVSKSDIEAWSKKHNVKWVLDKSNNDTTLKRNYVRKIMMEHIKVLNPGIETTIARKVRKMYEESIKN